MFSAKHWKTEQEGCERSYLELSKEVIIIKNSYLIAVVLLIVGLGAGFFGGMQYQKHQTQSNFPMRGAGRAGMGRFGAGMGATVGMITSSDSNSITVQMSDGSSKIVVLSGNTSINKAAQGSKSDLVNGTRVAVFGMTNSDGSVTATNIQINPMMRMGAGASPSAQPQ